MKQFGTTLTSTINFMTRGFDNLTLTFYVTKLYDHDKDKDKVYKPLDTENNVS